MRAERCAKMLAARHHQLLRECGNLVDRRVRRKGLEFAGADKSRNG